VVRLGLIHSTAVSRFRALTTLTAGASQPIRVGGYAGLSSGRALRFVCRGLVRLVGG
jgi:hypothetical protein